MKNSEKKRSYHMMARADQVARNDRKIMDAVADLWLELPLPELTLEKVAEKSGVTVRTILRKFGSKEGLIKTSIENNGDRFTQNRMQVIPGDLPGILDALLEEYERMGDAMIRTLTVEFQFPSTAELLIKARLIHREWCEMVFRPFLPERLSDTYETILSSFIASTEFYLWKLMRKDLGKSPEQTRQIFLYTLQCLAKKSQTKRN
jgi:AcrR family transcriptional regulator